VSFPLINPSHQWVDTSGNPLVSGTIEFQNPTTAAKINTYPTADDADAQTNANANPLTLDSRGGFTGIYLEDGVKYKVIIKDSSGTTVDTQDDVWCPLNTWYSTQTSAESSAGVTPTDYSYPEGNVKRYGATGDGATDDAAALNSALSIGGDIYFPAGTYLISASLTAVDYTTIRAVGRAIIKGHGGYTSKAFSINSSTGLTFDGLEFDDWGETHDMNTSTDLTIKNCRVINGVLGTLSNGTRTHVINNYVSGRVDNMGIAGHGGSDIIVDGNHVVNAGDNGIAIRALTSNLTRCTITNNQIDNAGKSGIKCRTEATSTAGVTVKDAIIANNIINGWSSDESGAGVDVPNVLAATFNERIVVSDNVINSSGTVTLEARYINAQQCNNSTISGNSCDGGVGLSGITVQAAEYVAITGNHISGACQDHTSGAIATQGGILLSTSDYCTVTGNSIKNTGSTTTPKSGIFVRTSTYNTIVGNMIFDSLGTTMDYGIEHTLDGSPDSDFNVIVGNNISGAVTGAIDFDASRRSTMAAFNRGYVNEATGTGSITSGGTTDVITHGLGFTPTAADITITLTEDPTNTPGAIFVNTITSTQFTVNCENDPGASNLDFSWKASIL